ncbi:Uncharacterized conserved protein, DUF305 family [Micromonospora pattaloongensis]|uniref:Uncharacterized conserved protein, DUF305 family n=1 Tax=Micromonospora pattaloongensis TaxID=405436 RepID=A0A1H3QPM4_9ACTN|nr:DUF305 domain-containing protein [Micromonospora pattaloongensis]SDZ15542.1 Uncharacterized conserved protein, DUF305 family [Micromonospora pattaloongensis]
MTVNVPRRSGTGPAGVAALLAGLLFVAVPAAGACASAPSAPPAPTPAGAGFGRTDAAWIQLMIPMNEQVLEALALVPRQSSDARLRALAGRIAENRRAELEELRRLRGRAGLPTANEHEGHDLPGMVVAADLVALRSLRAARFDRAIAETLREHVEQGARLADAERTGGTDPETRRIAARVQQARATEIAWLTSPAGTPPSRG